MATDTANITALYEDVVADLIPYYDNFVLLPNPSIILNSYNITGGVGNTMKIPLTNSWTAATGAVTENSNIIGVNDQDFLPTSVSLSVSKRGAGTLISEESFNTSEAFRSNSIRKTGEFRGSLSAKAYGNPEPSLINRMIRKVQRLSLKGVGLSSPKRLSPAYAG